MFAESRDRIHKGSQGQGLALLGAPRMQRAMRRRKLKASVKRLKQLQEMKFNDTRQLLLKLGEAKGSRYRADLALDQGRIAASRSIGRCH